MIRVQTPASTANLGTGVDSFGIALEKYLTVDMEISDKDEVSISGAHAKAISNDKNMILIAAKKLYEICDKKYSGLRLDINCDIPISRGMGSSSSAIIAGLYGANALLGNPLSERELIYHAGKLEGHYDNVLACALGGFTVAMPTSNDIFWQRRELDDLKFVVAIPDFELSTSTARSILPTEVDMKTVLSQIGKAAYLSTSIMIGDYTNLKDAMDDLIFTPARKSLIIGYDEVTAAAMSQGALSTAISGAGPTVIAYCTENEQEIALAMQEAFNIVGVTAKALVLNACNTGVTVTTI